MCDVEKRIEQWRDRLAASETLSNAEISELEGHLREEVAGLRKLELSEAEAFLVARDRLGDAAELEGEFAKVYGHRRSWPRLWSLCCAFALPGSATSVPPVHQNDDLLVDVRR